MHLSSQTDSRSPPSSDSAISRAAAGPNSDTAPPALTSGFGAVMEQEHDLQSSTIEYLDAVNGPHAPAIDRILRHQRSTLGANIALLEERYEMLPHPARFKALHGRLFPASHPQRVDAEPKSIGQMPTLVAQHLSVLRNIDTLIAGSPNGQRGHVIMTEVAHNHEEMAWMLTALLKEDETVRDRELLPIVAISTPGTTEGNWENEGGAAQVQPSPQGAPPSAAA